MRCNVIHRQSPALHWFQIGFSQLLVAIKWELNHHQTVQILTMSLRTFNICGQRYMSWNLRNMIQSLGDLTLMETMTSTYCHTHKPYVKQTASNYQLTNIFFNRLISTNCLIAFCWYLLWSIQPNQKWKDWFFLTVPECEICCLRGVKQKKVNDYIPSNSIEFWKFCLANILVEWIEPVDWRQTVLVSNHLSD